MAFRVVLVLITSAIWFLVAWTAMHQSDDPAVLGRYSAAFATLLAAALFVALSVTAMNFGTPYKTVYRARHTILISVGSIFISLLVAELFIRIVDPLGISYHESSRQYHLDKVADDELVFRHRANARKEYRGISVETNELGLRDEPIGPKASTEFRILVLGDSVTFGAGVAVEDVYSRALEGLAGESRNGDVRVINSGVGGYNTEQERAFLKRHGGDLGPDLVVLLYVPNDIEVNEPPFDPGGDVSISGKDPVIAVQILMWESWLYRMFKAVLYLNRAPEASQVLPSGPGWQRSMSALDQISGYCRDRQLPLAVFMYRLHETPLNSTLESEIHQKSLDEGFYYADTLPWFADQDIRQITNSVADSHPNAAGHGIIARGMAAFLQAENLL